MASQSTGGAPGAASGVVRVDRTYRIPFGDRWVMDAFELFPVPGGFSMLSVDMTQCQNALRVMRKAKIPATYPHLILRAVAMLYAYAPDNFRYICNYKYLVPAHLDIGLSMAGQTSYAPVVVIKAVDQKNLATLIPAVMEAVDAAAAREANDLKWIRRMIIPFKWMRRWILRGLSRNLKWRTQIVGHLQITTLTNVDIAAPFLFYSNAILGVGAIRDRVIAVDGQPAVRPTVWLTGVADHVATDGLTAGDFLQSLKTVLEGPWLVQEAREAAAEAVKARANKAPLLEPGEQGQAENSAGGNAG